jgi:hypothetical protein
VRVELTSPYWEPTTALMQMLFWRKNFEDKNCPSSGLLQPRRVSGALISFLSKTNRKNLAGLGLNSYSLICSQGKLTMLRCEKSKNSAQKRDLKSKRMETLGVGT